MNRVRNHVVTSARWIIAIALGALPGCIVVDEFSARAVKYNLQAEEAQNQGLLLNVIRASYQHPLHFTGLTTVSGTASTSSTLGVLVPFGSDAPAALEASPGATLSGGPTFSVAVLDTQQFVRGILTPLDIQTIDYFLQQQLPMPPPALFHLLFEKVDLVAADGRVVRQVVNSPGNEEKFREFQALIADFVAQGFTTERVRRTIDIGPPLTPEQASDLTRLADADAQGLSLIALDVADEGSGLTVDQRARFRQQGVTVVYQLRKRTKSARFCFRDPVGTDEIATGSRCGASPAQRDAAKRALRRSGAPASEDLSSTDDLSPADDPLTYLPNAFERLGRIADVRGAVRYRITPRSTEGVFHYLGEIVRLQTQAAGTRRTITVPAETARGMGDVPLFVVRVDGQQTPAVVRAQYRGTTYYVPAAASESSYSGPVLSLVAELVALNKAAEDLPAANVLTVIGR